MKTTDIQKGVKFYVEDETVSHGKNNEGKTRYIYTYIYTYKISENSEKQFSEKNNKI